MRVFVAGASWVIGVRLVPLLAHTAFDGDPGLSPVGHGEPDVDRRDQHKTEGVDRRRIEPPGGKWRRRLESAEDSSPEGGST